jgi:hypothetical protein
LPETPVATGTALERPCDSADAFAADVIDDLQRNWKGSLLTLERPNQELRSTSGLAERIAAAVQPLLDGVDARGRDRVCQHARAVIRCFLPSTELVASVDEEGLADLAAMSVASCLELDYFDDLEIRVGYGGAPLESPNLRTASYLVAPKQILLRLAQMRSRTETFAALEHVSHRFPAAKVSRLRAAVYSGMRLSEQQSALLAEVEDYVRSSLECPQEQLAVPFPKSLPRVIVYSAHEFLARINGDGHQIRACASQTMQFLAAYVAETCPPSIAARFTFDDDLPVATDPLLNYQLDLWTDLVERSATAVEVREKIARLSLKHSGDERAGLRYAVAHAAYAADPVEGPIVPILQKSSAMPDKLIMIGGPPEKLFWRLRHVVKQAATMEAGIAELRRQVVELPTAELRSAAQALLTRYQTHVPPTRSRRRAQLISRVGEVPVYSAEYAGREPNLRDAAAESFHATAALNIEGVRTAVREDLAILFQDVLGTDVRDSRAVAKGVQFLPADARQLQELNATLRRLASAGGRP